MSHKKRTTTKITKMKITPRHPRLMRLIMATLWCGASLPTMGWAATIQGSLFLDANNNGLKDTGEKPRASQVVFLRNNGLANNGQGGFYTMTSDANGNYTLSSQPTGNFTIWTGIPTGWQQTTPVKGQNMAPYDFTVASASQTVTVNFGLLDHPNTLPTIKLSSTSVTATAGEVFNFTATASDTDVGDTLVYKWDFGDGNSATSLTTSHTYATAGTYTATLTVTDDRGGIATGKLTVTVGNPHIMITSSQTTFNIDAGQAIDFATAFADVSGGGPYNYVWKFGDGNTSTGSVKKVGDLKVTHAYNQAGNLTATLEVTDKDGNKGTKQFVVQVRGVDSNPCDVTPTAQSQRAWGLWNDTSTWSSGKVPGANDWVLIKAGNTVVLPAAVSNDSTSLQVKGLCVEQNAVIQSDFNVMDLPSSWVNLNVTTLLNKGVIRGANGVNAGLVSGVYKVATTGSSLKIFASNIVNDTTGIIGGTTGGRGGDDLPYLYLPTGNTMNSQAGLGGGIELYPAVLTNLGRIESGKGGNAFNNINGKENLTTDDPLIAQTGVEILGTATGGHGGIVRIFPTDINTSKSAGQIIAGCGGSAYARANFNRTAGNSSEVSVNIGQWSGQSKGCQGSRAHWDLPAPPPPPVVAPQPVPPTQLPQPSTQSCRSSFWFLGRLLPWSCWWNPPIIQPRPIPVIPQIIRVVPIVIQWPWRLGVFKGDPLFLEYTSDTRIDNQDEVVIFGGEDAYIDMTQLSEGAISANKTITIATGPGGTVDLRGISSKVFNAGEKLEIFSDDVQLDEGVTVEDLTTAPTVEINPAKILAAPSWSSPDHLAGEPGTTMPVTLTLHNGGPAEDTYTLSITDTSGWELGTLPETITVESMRHSNLTVEVTLPETRGDNDILTLTATSQNDPSVQTVAYVRVSVMEEETITPRTGEKADLTLVIDSTASMGGEIQTVANALENFLTTQLNTEMQPTVELITFKDDVVSRVVTKDLAEVISRVRSIRHSGGGDCPNASVAALEYALSNLNPNGQIILATAASAEQEADTVVTQLQAQGIKTHVLLAGSCGNDEADKAFYQTITDTTGGTFTWLPRGQTTAEGQDRTTVLTQMTTDLLAETVKEVVTTKGGTTGTGTGTGGTTTGETGTGTTETASGYSTSGTITDKLGHAIPEVTIQIGGQTTTTDANGHWEIHHLPAGEYTAVASKPGWTFTKQKCALDSHQQQTTCDFAKPTSVLKLKVSPSQTQQGENLSYLVTLTNTGTEPATGIMVKETLPANTTLVALESLKGSTCDAETLTCTLPTLAPGQQAQFKVTVNNTHSGKLENLVTVTSDNYPTDMVKTATVVKPYLSVTVTDSVDPVPMMGQLQQTYDVALNANATSPATGVTLAVKLPAGVEVQTATTATGPCDLSQLPTMTCSLPTLEVNSHQTITADLVLKDPGLLVLTTEAKVTAENYLANTVRERTTIFVPDDLKVDAILVLDTTASMQQEINGVKAAVKTFIDNLGTAQSPTLALITFKDEVKVEAFTQDPKVLLKVVDGLKVSGGGLCPEASVEALTMAVKHLKEGGTLLLSTDASPYDDADVTGLATLLDSQNMKFHALVTGDCSQAGSWNELTK